MFDLRQEWLAMLTPLFAKYIPGYEVLAYGSRLDGNGHEASDLDLAIRNPAQPDAGCEKLGELREAIRHSNIPVTVDLHDWAALPAAFHAEIAKRNVLIWPDKQNERLDFGEK